MAPGLINAMGFVEWWTLGNRIVAMMVLGVSSSVLNTRHWTENISQQIDSLTFHRSIFP